MSWAARSSSSRQVDRELLSHVYWGRGGEFIAIDYKATTVYLVFVMCLNQNSKNHAHKRDVRVIAPTTS